MTGWNTLDLDGLPELPAVGVVPVDECSVVVRDRGDDVIAVIRQFQHGVLSVGEMVGKLAGYGVTMTAECVSAMANGDE